MDAKVVLVDVNAEMVGAWERAFSGAKEVAIVEGSMLDLEVDAWVSPTNAEGRMDGGLDGAIRGRLGPRIQMDVRGEIRRAFGGAMRVGEATCVRTRGRRPTHLVSAATMRASSEDVSGTFNAALACGAAFQAVVAQNRRAPGSIRSLALPGLGAGTGRVSPELCADLMKRVYDLFRTRSFEGFDEVRAALESELGHLGSPAPAFSFTGGSYRRAPSRERVA